MEKNVAPKLLMRRWGSAERRHPLSPASPLGSMNMDFQIRFTAGLLFLLTVASGVFAWINFQKEHEFQIPYDGVWWVERGGHLLAAQVQPNGPGDKAGIRRGDQLVAVAGREVKNTPGLQRQLHGIGAWQTARYAVMRHSVPVESIPVILVPAERSLNDWLRLIALIYLGIGIYVLLRRWTAPSSTHFYLFCLLSFVLYAFHFTGKLNVFDWIIYWSNVVAWMVQPAMFLHFVLTFPERREFVRKHAWMLALAYVPGALLLGARLAAMRLLEASGRLSRMVDRLDVSYGALFFLIAATILW